MADTQTITYIHPFWSGFGVFTGIVSGIAINLIINKININRAKRDVLGNIKFEIEYNISHLEGMLLKLDKLRKAVSLDDPKSYPCYLEIRHKIQSSIINSYQNGFLYEVMDKQSIAILLKYSDTFNKNMELSYNEILQGIYKDFNKTKASEIIVTLEKLFDESIEELNKALAVLP